MISSNHCNGVQYHTATQQEALFYPLSLLNQVGAHSKYLCDLTIRLLFSLETSMLNEGRCLNNFNFDPLCFSAVISCDAIAVCYFVSNGVITNRCKERL
jgi:hypothetical protein